MMSDFKWQELICQGCGQPDGFTVPGIKYQQTYHCNTCEDITNHNYGPHKFNDHNSGQILLKAESTEARL